MRHLGSKEVPFARIRGPSDIKKRLGAPHVLELAGSIKELEGTISHVVVRKSDYRLLAGRDRYAAHLINKAKKVWVTFVDCTDSELKKIERHENAFRRHDPTERQRLMAEMVNKLQDEILEKEPELRAAGPGPKQSARGKARTIVAKKLGVRPETVRVAEYHVKQKETDIPGPDPDGLIDSPVLSFGMTLDDEFVASVKRLQKASDDAAMLVSRALSVLTKASSTSAYPGAQLQSITQALKEAGAQIRRQRPGAICPQCKCIPVLQEKCVGCVGTGWVSDAQLKGVPPELLRDDEPMVRTEDGRLLRASSYFGHPNLTAETCEALEDTKSFGAEALAETYDEDPFG